MAGIDLGALKVAIEVENANALDAIQDTGKAIDNMSKKSSKSLDSIGKTFSKVGSNMTRYLSVPIAAAATAAIKLASDMQETMSKVDIVFGNNASEVKAWGDTTIEKIGLAKQTALDMAAGFQDMGTSMGIGTEKSADMSMSLVQLAGDLASFKNISVERAQIALNAIYTGETESLKALGIVMTDANLKSFAMSQGITKQWEEMTQAEKVMLRYQYVMSQTSNAQGDFERTSDSAANQSRSFKERVKELGASFGEKLLPIVEDVLTNINGLLDSFSNADESTQTAILWGLGIAAAIGPVTKAIGSVIDGIGKVKDAFASGAINMSTLGWVTGALAIVALIGTTVALTQQRMDEIYKDSNALNTAMSNLAKEMLNIESTFQKDMTSLEATSTLASDYIAELEKLEATGVKTREEQEKYAILIRQLKTLIPGLNIQIDKQTGLIKGGAKALREQTAAWKEQAILEYMLTKQKGQVEALTDAQIALTEAEIAHKNNAEALASIRKEQTDIEEKFSSTFGKTLQQVKDMTANQMQKWLSDNGEEAKNLLARWNELSRSGRDLEMAQSGLDTAIQKGTASVTAANAEVEKTKDVYQQAYDAMANTDAATAGTDAVVDGLEEVGTAADNAAKDVRDFSSDVSDMTKNLKDEADITMKEATKNLKDNTALYEKLWTNIGNLMKRGVSTEFLYHLQQMGPEGWKIIDEMNKSSDKKLQEFVDVVGDNAEASKKTWETEIGEIPGVTKDAMEDAADEAKTGGEDVGTAMGDGIGTGVQSTAAAIAAKCKKLVQDAIAAAKRAGEIASPSKKMIREVGKPLGQGVAVGFDAEMENTIKTVKRGIDGIVLGGVSATQQNAIRGTSSSGLKPVSVNQTNNFTSRTLTPYEIQLEQKKLSKNLLKGVS